MTAYETGPHVNAAFLCERVLTEADGTNTYVRIVDRVSRQMVSPERPEGQWPAMQVRLTYALVLKSGEARGTHKAAVVIRRPPDLEQARQEFDVSLPPQPNAGVNYHFQLDLELDEPGVWWIDFYFGDDQRLLSRTPLELQDLWTQGVPTPGPSPQP